MHRDPDASPFNALPPVVVALSLLILGIELLFQAGERHLLGGPAAVGWRLAALQDWGVDGRIFDWMLENRRLLPGELLRLVAYPLIHYSFSHALFVIVFVLALGKAVGEIFHPLAVFFGSAAAGALVWALVLDDPYTLAGGYPGVYGLIGAFSFMLWVNLGALGANRMRAFTLIGFLLGIQLLFRLLFGGSNDWLADLAGFGAGFLLSFVLAPGGWARVVARLRQR
jgi:membrane associated rhomboid family serine protease